MKKNLEFRISKKYMIVLILVGILLLAGCNKNKALDPPYKPEDIVEVLVNDGQELALVLENGEYVFYDKGTFEKVETTEALQGIIDKYKNAESDGDPNSEEQTEEPSDPEGKNSETTTTKPNEETTKPSEPSKSTEPSKPTEPVKASDKVTYGKVEYVDTVIKFKILESKADNTKELGTNGVLIKGVDGTSRKEVRKVYVNGKYSHTETLKNTYIYKKPVDQQPWHGTKKVEKPVDTVKYRDDYAKEVIKLVNAERAKQGLHEYILGSQRMIEIAKIRAEEIVINFSHGGSNTRYGEAIAKGIGLSPKSAVKAWLESEGHKKILLSPDSKYISVGAYDVNGKIHYVILISAYGN